MRADQEGDADQLVDLVKGEIESFFVLRNYNCKG